MLYFPLLNYANGNLDFLEVPDSEDCVNSLSDGGVTLREHFICARHFLLRIGFGIDKGTYSP